MRIFSLLIKMRRHHQSTISYLFGNYGFSSDLNERQTEKSLSINVIAVQNLIYHFNS